MTVKIDTLCSGLRANSQLTEVARRHQTSKISGIIEMIWKWLRGETENSDDFKTALPHILCQLEKMRQRPGGLTGAITVDVWLSSKQCLFMKQSADGRSVEAMIVTVGGYFNFIPRYTRSSLEVVNGNPEAGTTLHQLYLRVAKEVIKHSEEQGSDLLTNSVLHGFKSAGGNLTQPLAINLSDLLTSVRTQITESGDSILQEGSRPVQASRQPCAFDAELARQLQLDEELEVPQNSTDISRQQAIGTFIQNTPEAATIQAVRQAIQCKFVEASRSVVARDAWVNSAGNRLILEDNDVLSTDTLADSGEETEWCLFSTAENTFSLITAHSARQLLSRPSPVLNPYTREPLTANSFSRGNELLQWLKE